MNTKAAPPFPAAGTLRFRLAKEFARLNVTLYRRTRGRLGGTVLGVRILLLDHVGRRSGLPRTTPVHYMPHGADFVVVGSRGGSEHTPDWWRNLRATPATTIQVAGQRIAVTAREATGDQRATLWAELVEFNPAYALYQQRTTRELPVIVLQRRARDRDEPGRPG